jgi:tRNA(fMet)-specific endonuclease VapC
LTYLLDTNAVIAILRDQPPKVRRRLRRALARDATIAVSSVVLYELWYGVMRSQRRAENAERLRAFLAGNIAVVPFDEEDAAAAGELRARLEAAGQTIGSYDLLIAAQALTRRATLVTASAAEFGRISGLSWQNWAGPERRARS